ncbi:hypothetical protein EDC01DRAFT_517242 [Geopyxis carbonaria]|nr:hypothetical protein EDC01DRAFT_517242 [Geopyxis carbonaria]
MGRVLSLRRCRRRRVEMTAMVPGHSVPQSPKVHYYPCDLISYFGVHKLSSGSPGRGINKLREFCLRIYSGPTVSFSTISKYCGRVLRDILARTGFRRGPWLWNKQASTTLPENPGPTVSYSTVSKYAYSGRVLRDILARKCLAWFPWSRGKQASRTLPAHSVLQSSTAPYPCSYEMFWRHRSEEGAPVAGWLSISLRSGRPCAC